MARFTRQLIPLLTLLSLAAGTEPPQTPPPAPPPAPPITVDVLSAVPGRATLRITDRFGMPISGVHADQIEIVEQNYAYPPTTSTREAVDQDLRLRVFFVIDAPRSRDEAQFEVYRSAVRRTLAYLASSDHAAILIGDKDRVNISPAEHWELSRDYIGESGVFYREKQFAELEHLDNVSSIALPVLLSATHALVEQYADMPNLIFVLGSGASVGSDDERDLYDLTAAAGSLRTPHFTFAPTTTPNVELLTTLARLSGGEFARADDAAMLTFRMIDAVDHMRITYAVEYPPTQPDPPYFLETDFNVHLAGQRWHGAKFFEDEDFSAPWSLTTTAQTKNAAAPSSAPWSITVVEFLLTALGTVALQEAYYVIDAVLSARRKDADPS